MPECQIMRDSSNAHANLLTVRALFTRAVDVDQKSAHTIPWSANSRVRHCCTTSAMHAAPLPERNLLLPRTRSCPGAAESSGAPSGRAPQLSSILSGASGAGAGVPSTSIAATHREHAQNILRRLSGGAGGRRHTQPVLQQVLSQQIQNPSGRMPQPDSQALQGSLLLRQTELYCGGPCKTLHAPAGGEDEGSVAVLDAVQSKAPEGQPAIGAKPTRRFSWSKTV